MLLRGRGNLFSYCMLIGRCHIFTKSYNLHLFCFTGKQEQCVHTGCTGAHLCIVNSVNPEHISCTETPLIPAHHISLTDTLTEGTPHQFES